MQTIFPNLMVQNIEQTIAWYKKNLQATLKMSVPKQSNPDLMRFATLTIEGNDLMLQDLEDIENKYPVIKGQVSHSNGVALNIQVKDAQQIYEKLRKEVEVIAQPQDMFYGMREFTMRDPDGYLITVASMLSKQ